MYVIPYSMGPLGSKFSKIGVQVTDSPFVVANMRIMARMGTDVFNAINEDDFVRCWHSIGQPIHDGLDKTSDDYTLAHSSKKWHCPLS